MRSGYEERLDEVRERLKTSASVVVMTGAGVGAESGVPTFRGHGGLWKSFRAEELATPEAFARDPALVWEWYDWRRSKIASVEPNPAHYAIAEMEKAHAAFTLITQNVDGLHARAGSANVIELHGSIWRVRCLECGRAVVNTDVPIAILPRCECGGVLRPGVVWFGEPLSEEVISAALDACDGAEFMLVAGTSGVVQPAASLAGRARSAGAFVIEVNTETTPLSSGMDAVLEGRAGDILPRLLL